MTFWLPQWEVIEVEYKGIKIRVLKDKETGLLACPLCLGVGEEGKYFYDVPSLIEHLAAHLHKPWERKKGRIIKEEEEQ